MSIAVVKPDLMQVEASILALTASIERLETLPYSIRNRELLKRLRTHRGAFKLYRDGALHKPPPPIYRQLIVYCGPCPAMDYPPESESIIKIEELEDIFA